MTGNSNNDGPMPITPFVNVNIKECFNRGILTREEFMVLSSEDPSTEGILDIFESTENVEIIGYCLNICNRCLGGILNMKVGKIIVRKLDVFIIKNVDTLDMLALKLLRDIDSSFEFEEEYFRFLAYIEKKLEKYAENQEIVYWSLMESSKSSGLLFKHAKKSNAWRTHIVKHIHSSKHQIQYYMIFFLWRLSYDRVEFTSFSRYLINSRNFSENALLKEICKLLTSEVKPKVKRLALALLKNYSRYGTQYVAHLLRYQVHDFIDGIYTDDLEHEEREDLSELRDRFVKTIQTMSNFDEYYAELQSGELEWSPYHKSALFWKNNSARLEEKDNECLKLLLNILHSSKIPRILSVCLNDIQNYLINRPNSNKKLLDLGLKNSLIVLLESPNDEVKYQALITLQKFLCTGLQ